MPFILPVSSAEPPDEGVSGGARAFPAWWYWGAVAALFVLLALTYLLRPILEPDFFWHLKSGEWIWQNQALPEADPFSFAGPQHPNNRQLLILQGYWLAQLFYHAMFSALGIWGIYLLRLLLLAAFFGLFLWTFHQHRVNRLLAITLLGLFSIYFLTNYALERPQVFSFIAIGLVVILYRWFRDKHAESRYIAPAIIMVLLLLAVWANMHGGVLLGQGALLLVLLVETGVYLKTKNFRRFKYMLLFVGAGLAGSLLAPASLSFEGVLSLVRVDEHGSGSIQGQFNKEYFSVYKWLIEYRNLTLLIPISLGIASVFCLRTAFERGNYLEIVLLALFWVYALKHVRYLAVAMVFSLLFVAWNYKAHFLLNYYAVVLLIGLVFSAVLWTSKEGGNYAKARQNGLVDPLLLPVDAANFLKNVNYRGRIFNTYDWGGYLLWRLYPDVKVATDSRLLDEKVAEEMRNCEKLLRGTSGRLYWRDVMDKYAINVVVVPAMTGSVPTQISQFVLTDAEWLPVFRDNVSLVAIRKVPLPQFPGAQ